MLVLGIETSCDETAVAILRDREILADLIASQDNIHEKFGGIVPELAARRHLEIVAGMTEQARGTAGIAWEDLDGIAVTRAPGLIGALLVGLSFAKGLAFAHDIPLIGVNHLEGHLQVATLEQPECTPPFLALIVSGGHTSLYHVKDFGEYHLLGATRDDAAGEAFDKAAKILGLPFPGGPQIDRLAQTGNAALARFPRPLLKTRGSPFEIGAYDFSFSGLKTAMQQKVQKISTLDDATIANLCAGFQYRVVEELVRRVREAAHALQIARVVVAGGVAANRGLRARLDQLAHEERLEIFVPTFRYCTDNAVMIAWAGAQHLARGERHDFSLNAVAVEELGAMTRESTVT